MNPESLINMRAKNVHQLFFFRKDLNRWNYPEPMLVLLLFFPSQRELPLTELERLGLWAARRAREMAKKNSDDPQGTN
jgi:hypothetical protein